MKYFYTKNAIEKGIRIIDGEIYDTGKYVSEENIVKFRIEKGRKIPIKFYDIKYCFKNKKEALASFEQIKSIKIERIQNRLERLTNLKPYIAEDEV